MRRALMLAACIIIGTVGHGQTPIDGFDKAPPTRGVERFTAHTLRGSELQLGMLFTQAYQDLYVEAGLSSSVQLGISVLTTIGGQPYGWLKMVNEIRDELLMGSSLGLMFVPRGRWTPNRLYGWPGFVFSITGQEDFSLHAGLQVRFRVNLEAPRFDYVRYSPYVIVDTEIAEGFVLLGEASYNPTYVRVGVLMRVWDALDLKAAVGLPDLSAQFGADLRVQLGNHGR